MKKGTPNNKKAVIILHSGDFDKIMSAFIIGNGFLSMGITVSIFFTFWGLNALTRKGFRRAPLSRMNFFGLGKWMIRRKMKKCHVAPLEELAAGYIRLGGRIIACSMTMELMGIRKEDLKPELVSEYGTVGKYCFTARDAGITLFI